MTVPKAKDAYWAAGLLLPEQITEGSVEEAIGVARGRTWDTSFVDPVAAACELLEVERTAAPPHEDRVEETPRYVRWDKIVNAELRRLRDRIRSRQGCGCAGPGTSSWSLQQ